MGDAIEFGSAAWIDAARKVIEGLVAEAADDPEGVRFSVCEVYTHVPEHLEPDANGQRAWYMRIDGRKAELNPGEIDDADMKVVGEYAAILSISRIHYRNDPEGAKKAAALVRTAMQAGKLRVEGSQAKGPKVLAGFHDALAEITA